VAGNRDPGCKTEVENNETHDQELGNKDVTPQTVWLIAKSLANRDGPRAPTAIHGPLGPRFQPVDKANAIAECLEKQFTPPELCDENQ
jgi:hypothetical protein